MNQLPPGPGGMRLRPDDEIYRSNRSYLGPPGYTLPFRIPYRAMPVAAAVFIPGLILLRIAGVGGLMLYGTDAVISALLAALVTRFTGPERPVSALVTIFMHEISAPRPRRKPQRPVSVTMRPGLIPAGPLPSPRRSRRRARQEEQT